MSVEEELCDMFERLEVMVRAELRQFCYHHVKNESYFFDFVERN